MRTTPHDQCSAGWDAQAMRFLEPGQNYENKLRGFRNFLQENNGGDGFMVGGHLTLADLHAFNVLINWYKSFDRNTFVKNW